MKYIFDFDDVLFKNTKMLKHHMFRLIAEAGVPREAAEKDYYRPEVRWQQFSLKKFIRRLFSTYGIVNKDPNKLYEEIMSACHHFLNEELVAEVNRLGKENCYIVTNGEDEFNNDKLKYSGILNYFKKYHVKIVPDDKGDVIEEICRENKNEKIFFFDDKTCFIDELKKRNIPNLTSVLYEGESLPELLRKA